MPARGATRASLAVRCGLLAVSAFVLAPQAQADDALQERYGIALRKAIQAVWLAPEDSSAGTQCGVAIRQLPGGEVLIADVMPGCGFDEAGQQSLIRAVYRAAPLPYAGFERVFSHTLTISFTSAAR